MAGSSVTVAQICAAVNETIGDALVASRVLARTEDHDEMTEGVHDLPCLQVWPRSEGLVSIGSGAGETHKLTLGGPDQDHAIMEDIEVYVDFWAAVRHELAQDMGVLVAGIDSIRAIIKAQDCPPFGLAGVRTFQWSWTAGSTDYAGVTYLRARFTLSMSIF